MNLGKWEMSRFMNLEMQKTSRFMNLEMQKTSRFMNLSGAEAALCRTAAATKRGPPGRRHSENV